MAWEIACHPSRLRSISPYPQGDRDILVSYRDTVEPINSRILHTYLPGLSRYNLTHYGELNLDDLLRNPQFLGPNRRPWYRTVMLDTLDTLITSLSRNIDRSEATNLELSAFLEESLRVETYHGRDGHRHGLIYQRFYCLAQIASFARSERIQAVLTQFFTKYGGRITANETEIAVFEWCEVIIQNLFKASERVGCLREIIIKRPTIEEELYFMQREHPSQRTRTVFVIVRDMLERMYGEDRVGEFGRGRSRQRRIGYPSVQRYHSDSPPRRRLASRPPIYDRSYSGPVVPRGWDDLPRRALSQRADRSRIKRIEARIDQVEDSIVYVADKQMRQELAKRSARDIWSDSEDSRF